MLKEVARFAAGNANGFFEVYPTHLDEFAKLIPLTAISWGLCIVADRFLSNLLSFTGSSIVLTYDCRARCCYACRCRAEALFLLRVRAIRTVDAGSPSIINYGLISLRELARPEPIGRKSRWRDVSALPPPWRSSLAAEDHQCRGFRLQVIKQD